MIYTSGDRNILAVYNPQSASAWHLQAAIRVPPLECIFIKHFHLQFGLIDCEEMCVCVCVHVQCVCLSLQAPCWVRLNRLCPATARCLFFHPESRLDIQHSSSPSKQHTEAKPSHSALQKTQISGTQINQIIFTIISTSRGMLMSVNVAFAFLCYWDSPLQV